MSRYKTLGATRAVSPQMINRMAYRAFKADWRVNVYTALTRISMRAQALRASVLGDNPIDSGAWFNFRKEVMEGLQAVTDTLTYTKDKDQSIVKGKIAIAYVNALNVWGNVRDNDMDKASRFYPVTISAIRNAMNSAKGSGSGV